MLPNLIKDSNNIEHEWLKVKFLIKTSNINTNGKKFYIDPEEIKKFNDKYHKPEYIFFCYKEGWAIDTSNHKLLTKIKDKEKISKLIENITKLKVVFDLPFDSNSFYRSLNESLKTDKDIVLKLLCHKLKYSSLTDQLKYNADLALTFIEHNPSVINEIPPQFFNDINFSLKFAELMDKGYVDEKHTPTFITKFFENQEVKDNYHQYLKSYISFSDLKENYLTKEEEQPIKKNKLKV